MPTYNVRLAICDKCGHKEFGIFLNELEFLEARTPFSADHWPLKFERVCANDEGVFGLYGVTQSWEARWDEAKRKYLLLCEACH